MSIAILFLGIIIFTAFYLLVRSARKKQWIVFSLVAITLVAVPILLFRPVCVPIENGEEDARKYNYEQREDKSFYMKVFQKKDGEWHHCKTWIARQFFF